MSSIIDHNGEERRLGLIPPDAAALKLRASMPSFSDLLSDRGMVLYTRDQWEERDRSGQYSPEFVNDQRNCSGCVGWSAAGAEMKLRVSRGMPFERLSGAYVYAHINGGQDAGAMITHAMGAEKQYGHCLESEFDYPHLYVNQIPESAKQSGLTRQSTLAYTINSLEEFFTAIMLGLVPQHGVCVGGNFNSFDSNGFAGFSGGYANHSVHSFGMKKFGNEWGAQMGNSWGASFGPFRKGWCYLHERALRLEDAFVHTDAEWIGN